MYKHQQAKAGNFRGDYAASGDFCRVFENNMKRLYLLGFLLTANHQEAEQCFATALDEASENRAVFQGWVSSWIGRSVIKAAIRSVFRDSQMGAGMSEQWWEEHSEPEVAGTVNAITKLAPLNRFVFVMSVLEGYSTKECALLLDRDIETVTRAKGRALEELRLLTPTVSSQMIEVSKCLEIVA
jgi:DNA-directed RNA polymerase specialized sigma24 family protein